jgi:hypothetical protein
MVFNKEEADIVFAPSFINSPFHYYVFYERKGPETTEREYVNSSLREIGKVDKAISLYFKGIKEDLNTLATDPRVLKADSELSTLNQTAFLRDNRLYSIGLT